MNTKVIYSQTNCFIFTMTNRELPMISLGNNKKTWNIMKNRIVMRLTRGSVEMLFVGESSPASVLFFVLRCILYTSAWPPPARLVHPIITRRSYSYDVIALKRTENITNAGQKARVVTLLLCICLFIALFFSSAVSEVMWSSCFHAWVFVLCLSLDYDVLQHTQTAAFPIQIAECHTHLHCWDSLKSLLCFVWVALKSWQCFWFN